MALNESSVDGVGEREFKQVPRGIILVLIGLETA